MHETEEIKKRNEKICQFCGEKLHRKEWIGKKRRMVETNKRWNERKFCNNICRSKQLSVDNAGSNNYFYGKYLIPHNMKYEAIIKARTGKGYIQIRYFDNSGNRIVEYEHRKVMSDIIGRNLIGEECVHHKDGDITNNMPENLTLFHNNAEHKAHHTLTTNGNTK